jgi:sterol desaturase/sphingolipid hydroxylase (fatty acid hydroxylase superfamily)
LGTFSFRAFFVPAPRLFFFMGRLIMPTELLRRGSRCRDGVGQERKNMLGTILIILLILLLVGALPTWPYSTGWGYYPGGGIGLILIIVLLLVLVGRI